LPINTKRYSHVRYRFLKPMKNFVIFNEKDFRGKIIVPFMNIKNFSSCREFLGEERFQLCE
jgi:hypothetical protein